MTNRYEPSRNRWIVPVGEHAHLELTRRADGTAWFSMTDYNDASEDQGFTAILQPYEIRLLVAALADMTASADPE